MDKKLRSLWECPGNLKWEPTGEVVLDWLGLAIEPTWRAQRHFAECPTYALLLYQAEKCYPGISPLFLFVPHILWSKKGTGGGRIKSHARQKIFKQIVSIVLWFKEYRKGFFFPNRILRNKLYLFMYIVHNWYSVITANCFW